MTEQILIFGATGLFGELLARRLGSNKLFKVVGLARNQERLDELHRQTGITTAIVNRDDEKSVAAALAKFNPFAVVDCSGPFQYYSGDPYRFARQVLLAGSHYIDIADATSFVEGFTELDSLAKENGLMAITGASSSPAISAAAVDHLADSMDRVVSIETAIIPGNRARRTLSVIRAILGQVGQPFEIQRHGKTQTVYGWSETRQVDLALPADNPVRGRLASLVNTPEVSIFPDRYGAESVAFYAGLEIKTFHRILQLGGRLVRTRLIKSLAPMVNSARWIASHFESIGSDVGGMQVSVIGKVNDGRTVFRIWDLVADDGFGPEIPTLPVSVLLNKLQQGTFKSGARAACGEVTLKDLRPFFKAIGAETTINEEEQMPIFKRALGESFCELPDAVQALHSTVGQSVFKGQAESLGSTGLTGWIAAKMNGFPAAAESIPVKVTIQTDKNSEVWLRDFDGRVFKSRLSLREDGQITETFGPLTMLLGLHVKDNCLHFPVSRAKFLGIVPLPRFLLPKSIALESVDSQGRFRFDVHLLTPFGSRIAHYRGCLEEEKIS